MKFNLIVLLGLFGVAIADVSHLSDAHEKHDGYNYDKPAVPFNLPVPTPSPTYLPAIKLETTPRPVITTPKPVVPKNEYLPPKEEVKIPAPVPVPPKPEPKPTPSPAYLPPPEKIVEKPGYDYPVPSIPFKF